MNSRSTFLARLAAPVLCLTGAAHATPCVQVTTGTGQDTTTDAVAKKAPDRGDPFLWRITGAGTSGYLFGTIHLPDARILELPKAVESAFVESDAFFAEIDATKANEAKIQMMARLPQGESAKDLLGEKTWARVTARIERAVTPAANEQTAKQVAAGWDSFEPWAINAMLPMLDYFKEQIGGAVALDKALYDRASREDKRVGRTRDGRRTGGRLQYVHAGRTGDDAARRAQHPRRVRGE